jgi:glycosyltransferase 2 family protein
MSPTNAFLLRVVYVLIGVLLLAAVLWDMDVAQAWAYLRQVGWWALAILAVYMIAFVLDCGVWMLALPGIAATGRWLYRLWKVRMVGEAVNNATPAASLGGEPVKAMLLHRLYGIDYPRGFASVVAARTVILMAMVIFLALGFALALRSPDLSPAYKLVAGLGLAAFVAGIGALFAVQRFKVTSRLGRFLGRNRLGQRLEVALGHLHDVEDRMIHFYTKNRAGFAAALALAFANWLLGVVELYVAMLALGRPVSWEEAWIIESLTQLARAGAFFIPASLGAQEGAFVLVTAALTGDPALGLASSIVRRAREIVVAGWGFALGWRYLGLVQAPR